MVSKKKLVLIALAFSSVVFMAGCSDLGIGGEDRSESSSDGAEGLAESTGTNSSIDNIGESYYYEVGITETNQQHLVQQRPPFELDDSLERQNLIQRYQHLNDGENEHHVYFMSNHGDVIAYFVAQGKVSSVNSQLTNNRQIVPIEGCGFDGGTEGAGGSEGPCYRAVESPQMDGSYGTNGDGIFFFTTGGQYVEWNGLYVVSEEPQNINTAVSLVQEVDEDGNVVTDGDSENSSNDN